MEKRGMMGLKGSRGRSDSCGSIEEIWIKKREEQLEGGGGGEEAFRGSKKTARSPDVEKGMMK